MKIIYYTKYSRKGASSRLRSYQYFPYLEENGMSVTVCPLFGNRYLDNLYEKRSNLTQIIKSYIRRFCDLRKIFTHDRVVIEKELFPYLPAWFEFLLNLTHKGYIVDYDDAIFHNYDLSKNGIIRFFLKNKIEKVMKYSHVVIAGNSYLRDKAIKSGAQSVVVIPTVIDLNRYIVKEQIENPRIIIGWIGSRTTFKYLLSLQPVLKQLIENYKYNIEIRIVGCDDSLNLGDNESHIKWTEDTEVNSIRTFDIGIMPLDETPWELGKCAYKLIQYMACGVPVVATAIGANNDIVDVNCGRLVTTEDEWMDALSTYINNFDLRSDNGRNGRKIVEERYCVQYTSPTIIKIIKYDS